MPFDELKSLLITTAAAVGLMIVCVTPSDSAAARTSMCVDSGMYCFSLKSFVALFYAQIKLFA